MYYCIAKVKHEKITMTKKLKAAKCFRGDKNFIKQIFPTEESLKKSFSTKMVIRILICSNRC